MSEEVCLKWVGDKCVKWGVVDGKLTAEIDQDTCSIETMKEIKKTLAESDGFRLKFLGKKRLKSNKPSPQK